MPDNLTPAEVAQFTGHKHLRKGTSMRPIGCKCDFRTYMVGDGCEICNPAKALEYAKQTIDDLRAELAAERERCARVCEEVGRPNPEDPNSGLGEFYAEDVANWCAEAIRAG